MTTTTQNQQHTKVQIHNQLASMSNGTLKYTTLKINHFSIKQTLILQRST